MLKNRNQLIQHRDAEGLVQLFGTLPESAGWIVPGVVGEHIGTPVDRDSQFCLQHPASLDGFLREHVGRMLPLSVLPALYNGQVGGAVPGADIQEVIAEASISGVKYRMGTVL